MRKFGLPFLLIALIIYLPVSAQDKPYAFVAVGDTGCGCSAQTRVSQRLIEWHLTNPFSTVVMLGDNIYGSSFGTRGGSKSLFEERFDKHYFPLLNQGVKFYATLGNHDYETRGGQDEVADKKRFNILGAKGYYSFVSDAKLDGKPLGQFISRNSVAIIKKDRSDSAQIAWLSKTLSEGGAVWKVIYFHHPLYAPAGEGHEPEVELRRDLEDVFVAAGVQLVLAGHNHYYARMKTQRGITHFISGGGGRSLKDPIINQYTQRAAGVNHFIYFEVYPDKMNFKVVSAKSNFSDDGTIPVAPPGGNLPAVSAQ
jgi:hypothetical protein